MQFDPGRRTLLSLTGAALAAPFIVTKRARAATAFEAAKRPGRVGSGRVDVIYFPDLELNDWLRTRADPGYERVADYVQILGPEGKPTFNHQAFGLRKEDKVQVRRRSRGSWRSGRRGTGPGLGHPRRL